MQKFVSIPFIKTMVYGNVFIALCSLAQVLLTYMVFPIPINVENNSYVVFIFLSTYLQYNVQRGMMLQQHHLITDRSQWISKHKKILLITIGLSLIMLLFLCNTLSYTSIGIMVGAEAISTLYYMKPFNLRRFGYIKPFLISLIWVISCVTVPLIENHILTLNSCWFMLSQFLFIATLCVLFDIKDTDDDYMTGINTYANKFGITFTKKMAIFLIIGSSFCYVFFYQTNQYLALTSVIISLITAGSIFFITDKRHSFYYYLWIDGLLILQAIILLLFTKLL